MTASSTRRPHSLTTQAVRSWPGPQPPGVHPRLSCGQTSIRWHFQTAVRSGVVTATASLGLPRWRFALHRGGSDYDKQDAASRATKKAVSGSSSPESATSSSLWWRRSTRQRRSKVSGAAARSTRTSTESYQRPNSPRLSEERRRVTRPYRTAPTVQRFAPALGATPHRMASSHSSHVPRCQKHRQHTSSKDQRSNAFSMD